MRLYSACYEALGTFLMLFLLHPKPHKVDFPFHFPLPSSPPKRKEQNNPTPNRNLKMRCTLTFFRLSVPMFASSLSCFFRLHSTIFYYVLALELWLYPSFGPRKWESKNRPKKKNAQAKHSNCRHALLRLSCVRKKDGDRYRARQAASSFFPPLHFVEIAQQKSLDFIFSLSLAFVIRPEPGQTKTEPSQARPGRKARPNSKPKPNAEPSQAILVFFSLSSFPSLSLSRPPESWATLWGGLSTCGRQQQ